MNLIESDPKKVFQQNLAKSFKLLVNGFGFGLLISIINFGDIELLILLIQIDIVRNYINKIKCNGISY